ncbi:SH3 domain-containing protein 19 isoform X1 [Labeo rohita]|uniref:SH3 domain-containing protein 19 isoform X1 n=1 Tax=Labeo rohita TaxID=84645 RepID=UPI0021E2964D|nr:SH3 domain-containing protein 19 isoform X1 [Labeo rohita]
MAEARAEEEEERLRDPGGARRSSEHSDRNKPDQRHSSQGPLSSIRAVIKRTSTRTSAQSEHQRDRSRRPEITILSAEPLVSNTWFPGASGAFPPAPPPAPPTWAAASATVQLPPPSYEQVIREKSREQNLHSSPSSSSSPSSHHSTSTIATQTDTDSSGRKSSAARPAHKPPKPPRPSLPLLCTPELDRFDLNARAEPRDTSHEQCGVQTDFDEIFGDISPIDTIPAAITPTTSTTSTQINFDSPGDLMKEEPSVRPRPRPRSRIALRPNEDVSEQPMTREVKVQTLVRLKDDAGENIFAGFDDAPSNISSKYLQDLMEVFGSDETHVHHGESQQSDASTLEKVENTGVCDAPCAVKTPEPAEPLKRPQPRPRTLKSKPQLAPKPSVFEVFDTIEPAIEQNPAKPLNPPVPAPRPLLNKLQSPSESKSSPSTKPSPAARPDNAPSGQQMAAVAFSPPERRNSDDQATNIPVKMPPAMVTNRNHGKRPSVPKLSRPPPPVLRKTLSTPQVMEDVSRAADASIPSLPPRSSSGRLLPLRPPPAKVTKPPSSSSSSSPAATNQLPSTRVPKKGPPLPPRPQPGHPLYKRYSSKTSQRDAELENINKEQEKPSEETSLHEEEHLIVLDDTDVPQTPSNTLHDLCVSGEVKGQDVTVSELLVEDEPSEQQIQQNTQNRCVEARFAFEGEEGELSFSEGDVITLTEYVNEEWGRGILNGRTGIFPLNFIQDIEETETSPRKSPAPPAGVRTRGRALYDFTPESEDELCLKAGDVVCDLEDMDAEWFLGESGGKRGIVPKNYIQVLLDP